MTPAAAVKAMLQNILGEATEEEVITAVTYKTAPRYDASGDSSEFGQCWAKCKFNDLHVKANLLIQVTSITIVITCHVYLCSGPPQ